MALDGAADPSLDRITAPVAAIVPVGDRLRVRIGPVVGEVVPADAAAAMGLVAGPVAGARFAPADTRLVPAGVGPWRPLRPRVAADVRRFGRIFTIASRAAHAGERS